MGTVERERETIFLAKVPPDYTKEKLAAMCMPFGQPMQIMVKEPNINVKSSKMAWICFESTMIARRVVDELKKSRLDITIDFARENFSWDRNVRPSRPYPSSSALNGAQDIPDGSMNRNAYDVVPSRYRGNDNRDKERDRDPRDRDRLDRDGRFASSSSNGMDFTSRQRRGEDTYRAERDREPIYTSTAQSHSTSGADKYEGRDRDRDRAHPFYRRRRTSYSRSRSRSVSPPRTRRSPPRRARSPSLDRDRGPRQDLRVRRPTSPSPPRRPGHDVFRTAPSSSADLKPLSPPPAVPRSPQSWKPLRKQSEPLFRSKGPRRTSSPTAPPTPPIEREVEVTGLPVDAKLEDIKALFGNVGELERAETPGAKGTCTLRFVSTESAVACVEFFHGGTWRGGKVDVSLVSSPPAPPMQDDDPVFWDEKAPPDEGRLKMATSVLVRNVPLGKKVYELEDLFALAGKVVFRDVDLKGRGFVVFATVDDCERAVEVFHLGQWDGCVLRVVKHDGAPFFTLSEDARRKIRLQVRSTPTKVQVTFFDPALPVALAIQVSVPVSIPWKKQVQICLAKEEEAQGGRVGEGEVRITRDRPRPGLEAEEAFNFEGI
ncbi:hypothetical protein M427DRAFT_66618 [Gonapodya prolifera JEL478]|uniref:RRM domain-containing protein n=1 Tax=Gonapodya prolifera (strain JEL478) TaxID=1344416 RepID=A0A139ATD4_GONPJ|nr:hypothetical protein M427DRAFT_66618 [Gonapodya prolifera JEL478]|eukprot:KXS19991.1 hypothetical protein M427DRAFT_66618 [Gonapodya prolifera JEL478]